MPWKSVVYKRVDLHKEVWAEPVRTIAKKYGISDVALAKICRKLDVPLPGRGHWARKAAGHEVAVIPLPALKRGQPAQYSSARHVEPEEEPTPLSEHVARLVAAERDASHAIVVPEVLAEPHPLIRMSLPILRRAQWGQQPIQTERCLDVLVSKASLDRALCLMDALLKALEARGFEIEVTEPQNPDPLPRHRHELRPSRTSVRIGESVVGFGIEEKSKSFATPPPPPGSHEYRPRYERRPNGQLSLFLRGQTYSRTQQGWTDGKRQRVESCLNDFVAGLIAAAEDTRLAAIRAGEERLRQIAARREAEAAHRQQEAHQVLIRDLDERMDLLRKAREIQAFADRIAEAGLADEHLPDGSLKLDAWLEWARARATRLERRALTGIMKRERDISNRTALLTRFGWAAKPSTATLLAVVFDPYDPAPEDSEATTSK